MSVSVTSFHVFGKRQAQVIAAARFGGFTPAWISPRTGNWVSVFPAPPVIKTTEHMNRTGLTLSRTLDAPVFSFILHESKILLYTLFLKGEIAAEYDSFPELADMPSQRRYRETTSGKPKLMIKYCREGATVDDLNRVLYRKPLASAIDEVIGDEKMADEDEMMASLPEDYIQNQIMLKRGYVNEDDRLKDLAGLLGLSWTTHCFQSLESLLASGGKKPAGEAFQKFSRVTRERVVAGLAQAAPVGRE